MIPRDEQLGQPDPTSAVGTPVDDQALPRWLWVRLRTWWPIVALTVAILAVAALTATLPDTGLPLDPDSTGPDGTRALIDLLDALDHPVEVVGPGNAGDADVVLLLDDELDGEARDDLRRRVTAGGRLVVADPRSEFAPDGVPVGFLDRVLTRSCDVVALRDVSTIRPAGGVAYEVPEGATGCFDTVDGAWLVVEPMGRGHVVSLGGAGILTNGALGDADHATLIAQLLTPADGGSIAVVRPTLDGSGDGEGLGDLVPSGVQVLVLQLLVAFGVFALWRARRLGPPLIDRVPVPLASAEQTDAVGALFARNTTRADATARIARDTRRRLARRVGLADGAATEEIARAIADRTGQDGAALAAILEPDPPTDDAGLLRATNDLAAVERTVLTAVVADVRGTVDVH